MTASTAPKVVGRVVCSHSFVGGGILFGKSAKERKPAIIPYLRQEPRLLYCD